MTGWWGHLRLKVLTFGVAMSVLPLAIFGWYSLAAARSAQAGIVQAQNGAAARAVAAELAQFVRQLTTQLQLLSRLEGAGLVSAPAAEQERVLYTLLRDVPYLEELAVVDGAGRERVRASRREVLAGREPALWSATALWQQVSAGRSAIGPVTIDSDGRPLFPVAVPLPDQSGALVGRATLRGLVDSIATLQAGSTMRIHVIDGFGRLIGDSDFSLVLAGIRPALPPQGGLPYRSVTGEEAFGVSAPVPGLDWQVVSETTVADAMVPVRRLAVEFVLGGLLLMAVVVALSIVFGLELTVPLERLEAGARRVGTGDLTTRIPAGGRDELGRLVDSFNAMTQRLEAQDSGLRAERDRLDRVVSAIGAGMALIDSTGAILWVNQQLALWLPGPLVGAKCHEVLGRMTCRGYGAGCPETIEERAVTIRGRTRRVRFHSYPLDGSRPGEPARLEVLEDVTEQRALAQTMLQSEKLAAVGQLAAGVAHEINNPLAVIAAYAEDLSDRLREEGAAALAAGGELGAYLQQLQVQVQRAKGITSNLLDFARPGSGEPEPTDLLAVAQATKALVGSRARRAGVAVPVSGDAGLPLVVASRDGLQQVFLNLLTNALDALEEGGGSQISIRALSLEGRVRVVVADDGPGMDQESRERAMEPFFTTKPPGRGTGLGLSMCYGIITGYGGQMWLESEVGKGTQVWFDLPVWHRGDG